MAKLDTDWVRRYWDRSAGMYDRAIGWFERLMLANGRRWLASQVRGETLDRSRAGVIERTVAREPTKAST